MRYSNIFNSHSDYINNSGVTCRITQPPAAPRGATSVAAGPQDEARGHPIQAMQEAVGDAGVSGNGESVTSVPGAAGACWSHRKSFPERIQQETQMEEPDSIKTSF